MISSCESRRERQDICTSILGRVGLGVLGSCLFKVHKPMVSSEGIITTIHFTFCVANLRSKIVKVVTH